MGLLLPEEPKDIKELIKRVRVISGDEGNIDWDSFSAWAFNRLPKYLWGYWGEELRRKGITWQKFLKIMKLHTSDIVAWALYDQLEWGEVIRRMERTIETYSK
jgi:hypothetical protein